MREQFEKLPEIANRITESTAIYNEKLNWYECHNDNMGYNHEKFINGAWYSFQEVHKELLEQQNTIDEIKELMNEYYTGSFSTIEELAGEISAALTGTED